MLFDEFVEGTGCRNTNYNYQVYKKLEIIYMNDDTVDKEFIYEWGKKLVNNDLTDVEKAIIADWKAELEQRKAEIKRITGLIEYHKEELVGETDPYWKAEYKRAIKADRAWLNREKAKARELRQLIKEAYAC